MGSSLRCFAVESRVLPGVSLQWFGGDKLFTFWLPGMSLFYLHLRTSWENPDCRQILFQRVSAAASLSSGWHCFWREVGHHSHHGSATCTAAFFDCYSDFSLYHWVSAIWLWCDLMWFSLYLSCLATAGLPRLVVWYFKSAEQLSVPRDCSYRDVKRVCRAAGLCAHHWLQSEPFLLLSYSSLSVAGRLWTGPWWCHLQILMALCNPLLFMGWPHGLLLITSKIEYCRDGILS